MSKKSELQGEPSTLVRWGARAFAPSLDSHLADGEGPEASPLLTARALQLSSRRLRRSIADSWLDILIQSHQKLSPFDPRVPVVRRRVVEADDQIRAVADALVAPLTTARGVAMASSLLADGAGPLYNPANTTDLRSLLVDVLQQLDPLALSA
jgi:hypothetical protein